MIRRPPTSPLFPYTPLSRPPLAPARPLALEQRDQDALGQVEPRREVGDGNADAHGPLAGQARDGHEPAHALGDRSEEHTSELQSQSNLVCRLLLEKKKNTAS